MKTDELVNLIDNSNYTEATWKNREIVNRITTMPIQQLIYYKGTEGLLMGSIPLCPLLFFTCENLREEL